jgi:hypothetical protein
MEFGGRECGIGVREFLDVNNRVRRTAQSVKSHARALITQRFLVPNEQDGGLPLETPELVIQEASILQYATVDSQSQ